MSSPSGRPDAAHAAALHTQVAQAALVALGVAASDVRLGPLSAMLLAMPLCAAVLTGRGARRTWAYFSEAVGLSRPDAGESGCCDGWCAALWCTDCCVRRAAERDAGGRVMR